MTALDPSALRAAFGSYMTGVTVVTSSLADGTPIGFTANSFTSVSLDPPLLLVCPGKFISSYDHFAQCSHFAINILSEDQQYVANAFAGYKGDRFAQVETVRDGFGSPLIDGVVARFSCATHQIVDAGDHAVLIGNVRAFDHAAGRGLGYAGGQFFSLGLERSALEDTGRIAICGAIVTQGRDVLLEKTKAGYRPPQMSAPDSGKLRQDLTHYLTDQGLQVSLGAAYSVFDDSKTHFSYFLARSTQAGAGAFERHPIADLSKLTFASQPVRDMMQRFALESQSRSFGFYLGSAEHGDIHHLSERI